MTSRFPADPGASWRPLVAVSGGADSLALLLLTARTRAGAMRAATVDHGLRAAAAAEAAFVAGVCAARGVAHATLTLARPSSADIARAGGVQAWARAARYAALVAEAVRTGCDAVLTAHHADDQAETLLMRLSRGSGVDGLAGVRSETAWDGFPIRRPLLGWRRDALRAIVEAAGLIPVDDPTNADPAHARTAYRALLNERADRLDPAALARSAAAAADASEALDWSVAALAAIRIVADREGARLDTRDLPREYRRRLLIAALARVGTRDPRGRTVDRALAMLGAGTKAMVGATLIEPLASGLWRLAPAPPRRSH